MMELKHTPGPWSCEGFVVYGPGRVRDLAEIGQPIRHESICRITSKNDEEEDRGNARLICAALQLPKLLDALKWIVTDVSLISDQAEELNSLIDETEAMLYFDFAAADALATPALEYDRLDIEASRSSATWMEVEQAASPHDAMISDEEILAKELNGFLSSAVWDEVEA